MIDYSTYHHETYKSVFVLEAHGRLDATSADFMLECIQGFIERGERRFVIDCCELELITSFGLATLVRANSRLKKESGELAIAGAHGVVAEALRIVHFDRLFHLFDDVDSAAEAISE